jgi:hypothetical protein
MPDFTCTHKPAAEGEDAEFYTYDTKEELDAHLAGHNKETHERTSTPPEETPPPEEPTEVQPTRKEEEWVPS